MSEENSPIIINNSGNLSEAIEEQKSRARIERNAKGAAENIAKRSKREPGIKKTVPVARLNYVLTLCKEGYKTPEGLTIKFNSPAEANSTRQNIYEVRRFYRELQDSPAYAHLFNTHVSVKGNELTIGPHPFVKKDIMVVGKNGELTPFIDLIKASLAEEISQKPSVPVSLEVDLPLTYIDKFLIAALIQQALVEISEEKGIDIADHGIGSIIVEARKRGLQHFIDDVEPDLTIPSVADFYRAYSEEYNYALKMQAEGL